MKCLCQGAWLAAATWVMLCTLLLLPTCAPRYLEKTPAAALRYPFIPVSPEEIKAFQSVLASSPRSAQAAEARYWIAQDEFNRSQWPQAEARFLKLLETHPKSEWAPVAGVMAARTRVKQQNALAALALLNQLEKRYASQTAFVSGAQALAESILNDELTLDQLAQVRATYPGTRWDEQAWFVSGKRNLDAGQLNVAVGIFNDFLSRYPQSSFAPLARELKDKATRIVPVDRNRVGSLLPLSGPYAPYGLAIRQGLELAMEQVNGNRCDEDKIGLIFADTAGTPEGAVAGLRQLAEREKPAVIIGPALSNCAKALLPELNTFRIPVITTSASELDLPTASPYFFRYMLTNQMQAEAMAEFMVLHKNIQRIGIIHSQQPYDLSLTEAFERKVQQLGAQVVTRLEYSSGTTDFKTQMLALGGADPGTMKDLDVRERKSMERLLETAAYAFAQIIAPQPDTDPEAEQLTPVPIPKKPLAIIRFREQGEIAQKLELGKAMTEKFSYALAPRSGIKVLTQANTFQGLRQIGLSPLSLDPSSWRRVGEALHAKYLVLGEIRQSDQDTQAITGEPQPIHFEVEIQLVDSQKGQVIERTVRSWTKTLPPEKNIKNLEALYLPVSDNDAILIASQLAFYDLKVDLFGCDAWITAKSLRQGADALDGAVVATGFWPDDPDSRNQQFVEAYQKRFSARPSLLAVQAFDAFWLVAAIMQQVQSQQDGREAIRNLLRSFRGFSGVTGQAVVDPNGEIRRQPIFLKFTGGKLKRIR